MNLSWFTPEFPNFSVSCAVGEFRCSAGGRSLTEHGNFPGRADDLRMRLSRGLPGGVAGDNCELFILLLWGFSLPPDAFRLLDDVRVLVPCRDKFFS